MQFRFKFLASLLYLIIFFGCGQKPSTPSLDEKLNFSSQDFIQQIQKYLTHYDTLSVNWNSLKENIDTLSYYYSKRNYEPYFVKSFNSKFLIDSVLNILSNATEHGINPEKYNYSLVKKEFDNALTSNIQNSERYVHLANTELMITNAILNYSEHMRHGVINPRELYSDSYFLPVNDSLNQKYFEPLNQQNIIKYLIDIQPKNSKYKNLQMKLKRFESLSNIGWYKISVSEKKIEVGKEYLYMNNLLDKLVTLNFIDTSKVKITKTIFYDSVYSPFVKSFQTANGLIADGVIGKTTIERLNISPGEYVEKIKLNLERFRWINYSDTSKYILINIPDFKLYAVENETEKFDIKICAGRKITWETPNLYGQISYFVLNPTWSVPRSIIDEEIVSGLKRDSSYLKDRNFIAYKSGKQVSLNGLTAQELAANRYSLVQNPGAGNALGKIKFMFKNPFGVYLHDTPTRAPFNYVNRAVSHGCMRVEKPMQLAEYFLNNNSNWKIDYLKIEIGQKVDNQNLVEEFKNVRSELRKNSSYGVTTEVKLNSYIPLFVDYYTMWVDKFGKLNYRDDVYGRDKELKEKLIVNN
jgi:murein L,D-transpeptidase YcbB/YkuD